jgi:hypothetical protein
MDAGPGTAHIFARRPSALPRDTHFVVPVIVLSRSYDSHGSFSPERALSTTIRIGYFAAQRDLKEQLQSKLDLAISGNG